MVVCVGCVHWVVNDVNVGGEGVFFVICVGNPNVVFVVVIVDVCALLES